MYERASEDSRSRCYSARKEVRGSEASLELDGEFLPSQFSDPHCTCPDKYHVECRLHIMLLETRICLCMLPTGKSSHPEVLVDCHLSSCLRMMATMAQ